MASLHQPTLQDVLLGLKRFNEWQEDQEYIKLPKITVTDAHDQYFELCEFFRGWQPGPEVAIKWAPEEKALWIECRRSNGQRLSL